MPQLYDESINFYLCNNCIKPHVSGGCPVLVCYDNRNIDSNFTVLLV